MIRANAYFFPICNFYMFKDYFIAPSSSPLLGLRYYNSSHIFSKATFLSLPIILLPKTRQRSPLKPCQSLKERKDYFAHLLATSAAYTSQCDVYLLL